jgi:formyl-CoA transferase
MRLGEVGNADALRYGKPLAGVRVLALEQMQAVPYGTQLLARLGADVVKVEPPGGGESGRGAQPSVPDPFGRSVGATFLRNALGKRSLAVDVKSDAGRDLVLRLAPRFDVLAENFRPGTLDHLGLGYDAVSAIAPRLIYVSVSGFGNSGSPYQDWPAYAAIAESMSGIYEFMRHENEAPRANPVGALGDISSSLFAVIGTLAALRHRDATGEGQYVDIAMYDATVAMTDLVMNYFSLGIEALHRNRGSIIDTFRASDGWFTMQLVREHQFVRLTGVIDKPEWLDDPRVNTREGWGRHLETVLRPAIEEWSARHTKFEAARILTAAGIAASPCLVAREVVVDPHLMDRNMIVEMERPDGLEPPVLIPGNPVKMSKVADGPEARVPWLGEHTRAILHAELGIDDAELDRLTADGVIE